MRAAWESTLFVIDRDTSRYSIFLITLNIFGRIENDKNKTSTGLNANNFTYP